MPAEHNTSQGKTLDGIAKAAIELSRTNFQPRFRKTPYMEDLAQKGLYESVAGHMWGCVSYWRLLKEPCPNLTSAVGYERVTDILLHHDGGEVNGDIPIWQQLYGAPPPNKTEAERQELMQAVRTLPRRTRKQILTDFDLFETKDLSKVSDPAVLMAKIIDTLQGNLFVLKYGNNLKGHKASIQQIIQHHLGGSAKRLSNILQEKGEIAAYEELKDLIQHHKALWMKKGIPITIDLS